jgi:hypothetical protein
MVVVQVTGGLGNQMFQYALGRRLALARNCPLKLDISGFVRDPLRAFRLDRYQISAELANSEISARFTNQYPRYQWPRRLRTLGPASWHDRVVTEKRWFTYDPEVITARGNLYLIGFWQHEDYFKPITAHLREEFTPASPISQLSQEIANRMQEANSVSLHVRRGDYDQKFHGILPPDYYRAAYARLTKSPLRPSIFIFSDDPDWAKENLRFNCEVTVVRHNGQDREYEDLWLMTQCRQHIIANSSFSWWGAWLARFPNKIVIAPAKWMQIPEVDTTGIIPPGWITI